MRNLGLILLLFLLSCGKKNNISSNGEVTLINSCSIYGRDTRVWNGKTEQSDHVNSIAQMIPKSNIVSSYRGPTTFNIFRIRQLSHASEKNLCPDERFSKKYNLGRCSGFLIAQDLLMTSGHCMMDENEDINKACNNFVWSFNVKDRNHIFTSKNTYQCHKVIALEINEISKKDFAIIKLKRAVKDRLPLALELDPDVIKSNSYLSHTIIGHPLGMGQIIATNSQEIQYNGDFFYHYLPSHSGSSGSPIISNETGKVIGIHKGGDKNVFTYDPITNCNRYKICKRSDNGCEASIATSLSSIAPVLNKCNP